MVAALASGFSRNSDVPDHDPGVIVGEVGELRTADHVADGVDATVGGLELLVHLDAVGRVVDAGALEAPAT